jgi:hypothetical protein
MQREAEGMGEAGDQLIERQLGDQPTAHRAQQPGLWRQQAQQGQGLGEHLDFAARHHLQGAEQGDGHDIGIKGAASMRQSRPGRCGSLLISPADPWAAIDPSPAAAAVFHGISAARAGFGTLALRLGPLVGESTTAGGAQG